MANEFVGNGELRISKPQPFKNEGVGHPQDPKHLLGVDVLGWYHPLVRARQKEKREGLSTCQ
jgi:hypothetical protein